MEYHSDERPAPPRHCYACTRLLTPTHDDKTTYQYDNALWIGFHGGYAMFIDNLDVTWGAGGTPRVLKPRPDHEAVICHDCAHDLCDTIPWIASLLQPYNSHSHIPGSVAPDHQGWDLPHKPAKPAE